MRILYVDDEPDIREIAVLSLQIRSDFEVRSAAGGKEAVAIANEWQPDLILLDVMMPEMDGPMTRQALADDPETAEIPVAFVTARTHREEIAKFQRLDIIGVVPKPFDPVTLADEVEQLFVKR